MNRLILAAVAAACLTEPLAAQVTWVASNNAEAPNAIRTGDGDRRLCRAAHNGSTYSGSTAGVGSCTIISSGQAVEASPFEVAIGLAGWDIVGSRPVAILPAVGGQQGGTAVNVCRVKDGSIFYAGWYLTGAGVLTCNYGLSGVAKQSNDFQNLYPLDLNETVHMLTSMDQCVTGKLNSGSSATVIQNSCTNGSGPLWRLRPEVNSTYSIASLRTGLCLGPGTAPQLAFIDCTAAAARVKIQPVTDQTYRLLFDSGNFLNVPNASKIAGMELEQAAGTGQPAQQFSILNITDAARRMRVLSYNTMLLDTPIFPYMAQATRASFIADAIAADEKQADVVMLTEVFAAEVKPQLIAKLAGKGYPFFISSNQAQFDNIGVPVGSSGLLIHSRWPIEATRFGVYSSAVGADALALKGVLYARINKLGRRYHVFGTHLQSGFDNGITRTLQLSQMQIFIRNQTAAFPGEPILICGDMNIDLELQALDYQNMLSLLSGTFVAAPRPPGLTLNQPFLTYRWSVDPLTNQISSKRGARQEWLDYILSSTVLPTAADYRVIAYQGAPYPMSVKEVYKDPYGQQTDLYTDLSDHSALWGNLRYASAPLGPTAGNTVDGVFTGVEVGPSQNPAVGARIKFNGQELPLPVTIPLQIGSNYQVEALTAPAGDGIRWSFDRWKDGQAQSFTLVGPAGNTPYQALYRREYELAATAVPTKGGTVTGGGWYAPGTGVEVTATAAAGFRFTGFTGDLTETHTSGRLTMDGPRRTVANFVSLGKPVLNAATGVRSDLGPNERLVTIRLQNSGAFPASGVRVTSITGVQVLSGSGAVSVITPLPLAYDGILQGSEGSGSVLFQWPKTALRIRFTVNFTADNGYAGSTILNIFR